MRIRDVFHEATTALSANRMRSILTILGIVIGISSVIAMTSMVSGLTASLSSSLGGNQARLLQIGTTIDAGKADYETLADRMPELESIVLLSNSTAPLSTSKSTAKPDSGVIGAEPGLFEAMDLKMASGKFYSETDNKRANRVVVLGAGVVKDLYGDEKAQVVGETLSIGDDPYTIVGAMADAAGSSYYNSAIIPLNTMDTRLGSSGSYTAFALAAGNPAAERMPDIAEKTKSTFSKILGTENKDGEVSVFAMTQVLESMNMVMGVLGLILGGVAAISLLVGGVGIMNMMLTNVTERIREIGLRKALGAHRRDIVVQFLLESVLLTVVGGIIGMVFGLLGGMFIAAVISIVQPDMAFSAALDVNSVLLAVGVSAAIGIVFGYYPARRAAALDPIEALRYQ